MKIMGIIKTRRSVRSYSSDPIPREKIERCLEAARLAPSACNSQPWTFIVVDDPTLKNELAEAAFSGIYQMNAFAKKAPVIVVALVEKSKYAAKLGGLIMNIHYSLIDVGIACEHFVLQAEEEGLGTCWLGWFHAKKVKKILGLSKRTHIATLISLGFPTDANPEKEKQRKSMDEIRHYNIV